MKNIALFTAVAAILGSLALSACDSCPPQDDSSSKKETPTTCGQGTVQRGNTCVAVQKSR